MLVVGGFLVVNIVQAIVTLVEYRRGGTSGQDWNFKSGSPAAV